MSYTSVLEEYVAFGVDIEAARQLGSQISGYPMARRMADRMRRNILQLWTDIEHELTLVAKLRSITGDLVFLAACHLQ
jgi:hypothetical protein